MALAAVCAIVATALAVGGAAPGSSMDTARLQTAQPWHPPAASESNAVPTTAATQTAEGWFAPAQRTAALPDPPPKVTRCYVLPIREEITEKTFDALKRKVIRCRAAGAELIVLDMDTWGGMVIPALDITRMIKTDLPDVRVVCFVRTRAVSAGALIALSCHEIVMTPVGTFGDCAPMLREGRLEGVEREKIETVLRTEFGESAKMRGYSVALAQSMVSHDLEVWLVRHKKTRELRYVIEEEYRGRVDIPTGIATAPSDPKAEWEVVRVVKPRGRLLTMDTPKAAEYGFASHVVQAPPDDPYKGILERYHVEGTPTVLGDTWSEGLVEFLTSMPVMSFLLLVAGLCVYIEIHSGGHGIAAVIAVICFALAFGSRYMVGMAAWWELALFAVGLILIALEVFVLPGFGIPGILGIVFCVVGLLAMLVPNIPGRMPIPQTRLDWDIFMDGVFWMGMAFVLATVGALVLSRFLQKVPVFGRLVLASTEARPDTSLPEDSPLRRIRPGDTGMVERTCRPAGKVRFGQDLVDAVSQGAIIEPGAHVRALGRQGGNIVVEKM